MVRGSVRGSVRGELAPSARGGVRQPSKRVSALELDLALLTSCTFPPVTKSKYTHAVVCTVTPGQRTRTLPRTLPRIKWRSPNVTLQRKSRVGVLIIPVRSAAF